MTPPRGRLGEAGASLSVEAVHMVDALDLVPMVRHEIAPVHGPRNLARFDVTKPLTLLHPLALNVEVLHLAASGPLHNPSGRRGIRVQT